MIHKSSKGAKCSKCGKHTSVQQSSLGIPLCSKCMEDYQKSDDIFARDNKQQ